MEATTVTMGDFMENIMVDIGTSMAVTIGTSMAVTMGVTIISDIMAVGIGDRGAKE